MALNPADVSRIAQLARLELSGPESQTLLAELNGFFAIVAQMEAVPTHGVEPLSTPLAAFEAVPLRLRDDVVTEPASEAARAAIQASAPAVEGGFYLVPRVIE
jgi:aspartyl-tRNA(Asn)/glutamyl-tRNA(Gln) amidotransferase subunit C